MLKSNVVILDTMKNVVAVVRPDKTVFVVSNEAPYEDLNTKINDIISGNTVTGKANQAKYYEQANGDVSDKTIEESLDGKLDKVTTTGFTRVYAVNNDGQQKTIGATSTPSNSEIAMFSASSTLKTTWPMDDDDTTPKLYVDKADENVIAIIDGIELVKVSDLQYQLNVNGKSAGVINIPKDQFLKSVSYDPDTRILTFVFTTSTGDVTTTIDMSSLVDVYSAGNGLNLASNTFSIKLDPNANNALSLSARGLLLDKTQFASAQEFSGLNTDYRAFKTNQTTINSTMTDALLQIGSDIVTSETQTGAFIHGQNTLKGAIAKVEVQSENLVDWKLGYIYEGGITYTENDGIFTANGTAGSDVSAAYMASFEDSPIFKKGRYFLSGCPAGGSLSTYYVNIDIRDSTQDRFIKAIYDTGSGAIVDIDEDFTIGVYISIRNYTANNLVFKPKFQAGTVATPYTPYLPAGTPVNITACGENILQFPYVYGNGAGAVVESNGCKFTVGENGSVTITGKNNGAGGSVFYLMDTVSPIHYEAGEYYGGVGNDIGIGGQYENGSYFVMNGEKTFIDTVVQLYISIPSGSPVDYDTNPVTLYPYLKYGSEETSYKPYQGKDYSSQVGQTVDVEQYDGITNIFVTTVGGAVSTQFLLSTKYELNDKVNLLVGTLATRPTTTQAYGIIYIATDQTGANRVTYLPPSTDGSVSGNWISFNS